MMVARIAIYVSSSSARIVNPQHLGPLLRRERFPSPIRVFPGGVDV
jgi:hypothetical protein